MEMKLEEECLSFRSGCACCVLCACETSLLATKLEEERKGNTCQENEERRHHINVKEAIALHDALETMDWKGPIVLVVCCIKVGLPTRLVTNVCNSSSGGLYDLSGVAKRMLKGLV